MPYKSRNVAVGTTGTLIWQTSTGVSPDTAVNPANGIYTSHSPGDPLPILVNIPTGASFVIVDGSGTAIGSNAAIAGPVTIPFNVIGNDILYGAIAATGTVTVTVGRQ